MVRMKAKKLAAILLFLCLLAGCTAGAEHFALRSRDVGACRKLLGNIRAIVVIVNTPQHPWTQAKRDELNRVSWSSVEYMNKNAQTYHANAHFDFCYLEYTLSGEYDENLNWYWEILHDYFHLNSMQEIQDYYTSPADVDEAPVLFMFNSWALSHTYTAYTDYPGWNEEFCVIFCDTKMNDNYLTHELYHQYGAIDLYDYHNEGIYALSRKYFPNSVMRCEGVEMDDLNAYLIGWTDTLSDKAQRFLKESEGMR